MSRNDRFGSNSILDEDNPAQWLASGDPAAGPSGCQIHIMNDALDLIGSLLKPNFDPGSQLLRVKTPSGTSMVLLVRTILKR